MTINFQPYIQTVGDYIRPSRVERTNATAPVSAVSSNTGKQETDVSLIQSVDPVFDGELGQVVDLYA